MDNNDILIRLRYALDIKDLDMIEIFKLGGVTVTKEEVLKILTKSPGSDDETDDFSDSIESAEHISCTNLMLESFLNGFIIFKRGKQEAKPGQSQKPALAIKDHTNVNNVVLKKLKIALSLSSEDMLSILEEAGATLSKGELSAVFRKEGHRNYMVCGDRYVRNFLKGLALRYRR